MTGQHNYRAYGLAIASDFHLPGLEPAEFDTPDIRVRLIQSDDPLAAKHEGPDFSFGPDKQVMFWETVGRFVIHGTDLITVERIEGLDEDLVALPLLGPVMSLLLHLRGLFVLHASAMEVNGAGVVFMGDKGAGKSTTAGAFIGAGHRLLTDDVVAIDALAFGGPRIRPGFPQVKLDPGASETLGVRNTQILPVPMKDFPKDLHRLTGTFAHDEVIPRRIYVLERGGGPVETRLAPHDALAALMRYSYTPRFSQRTRTNAEAADELRRISAIVNAVPVCRLQTPVGLDRLPELVAFVEDRVRGD